MGGVGEGQDVEEPQVETTEELTVIEFKMILQKPVKMRESERLQSSNLSPPRLELRGGGRRKA